MGRGLRSRISCNRHREKLPGQNRIGLPGIGGEEFRHDLFACAQQRGQFAAGQGNRVYSPVLVDESACFFGDPYAEISDGIITGIRAASSAILYVSAFTSKTGRALWPSSVSAVPTARSPSDTTPTRRLSWFTTGMRRTHHSPIFSDTSATFSSPKQ